MVRWKDERSRRRAITGVTVAAVATAGVAARRRRQRAEAKAAAVAAASRAARTAELARLASKVGVGAVPNRARRVFASAERRDELDAALQLQTAEQVASVLGNMKGALMKIGQLASFVDDGMPEPIREALSQLQQNAPAMSPELAAGVIREELDAPPERIFAEWDPEPIAAASIGQVHRAITRDGRAVAVKVQYPGVEQAIRSDLDNLDLATMAMPFLWQTLDAKAVADEIRARLHEELDYRHEAQNQRDFAELYRGHPFIHVPEVVDELTTHRVLTTDLATGARFDEMERWDQDERNLAGETIFRFVFRSLYRFHRFNGDPHPGNYLFSPGGQVTFLDFGLVKHFTDDDIGQLLGLVQAAIVEPDLAALRKAAEAAGYFEPGAPISDERVAEYSRLFWESVAHDEVTTITREYATELTRRLMFAHQMFPEVMKFGSVAPRFLVLQRINVGLIAILGRLEATANWRRIAEEMWPMVDGPPSTELGRLEADWLNSRQ